MNDYYVIKFDERILVRADSWGMGPEGHYFSIDGKTVAWFPKDWAVMKVTKQRKSKTKCTK